MIIETVEHKYTVEVWVDRLYVGQLSDCEMDRWIWNLEPTGNWGEPLRKPEAPFPFDPEGCLIGRGWECIYSLAEFGEVPHGTVFINHGPVPVRHQRSYDAF